jgi:hypothetical protein
MRATTPRPRSVLDPCLPYVLSVARASPPDLPLGGSQNDGGRETTVLGWMPLGRHAREPPRKAVRRVDLLAGAERTSGSDVGPVVGRRLPRVRPNRCALPPHLARRSVAHRSGGERAVARRVPLAGDLRMRARQPIRIRHQSAGAVGATGAARLRAIADDRLPRMPLRAPPPYEAPRAPADLVRVDAHVACGVPLRHELGEAREPRLRRAHRHALVVRHVSIGSAPSSRMSRRRLHVI